MKDHPEPWRLATPHIIVDANGMVVARTADAGPDDLAERILSCTRVCSGIEDPLAITLLLDAARDLLRAGIEGRGDVGLGTNAYEKLADAVCAVDPLFKDPRVADENEVVS